MTAHLPAMSEFRPITNPADLDLQDPDEITAGYLAGLNGAPEPGSDRSRAFWHGWRNGRMDGGFAPPDAAQIELARAVMARRRMH